MENQIVKFLKFKPTILRGSPIVVCQIDEVESKLEIFDIIIKEFPEYYEKSMNILHGTYWVETYDLSKIKKSSDLIW